MSAKLERALVALRDSEIDFGEFVRQTRGDYHAMALHLMRKWQTPAWLVVDDVEQELYLGTWRFVWKHDATRAGIVRFVVFNAMAAAKRAMHKSRGVSIHGNPDKVKSQHELTLSQLGDDGTGDALLALLALLEDASPPVEDVVASTQHTKQTATRALAHAKTKNERYAILAIREAGSLDNAGAVLYDDVDHRTTLRLGCEQSADAFVTRHASAVARRMSGVRSI